MYSSRWDASRASANISWGRLEMLFARDSRKHATADQIPTCDWKRRLLKGVSLLTRRQGCTIRVHSAPQHNPYASYRPAIWPTKFCIITSNFGRVPFITDHKAITTRHRLVCPSVRASACFDSATVGRVPTKCEIHVTLMLATQNSWVILI